MDQPDIQALIAQIDAALSRQLNAILHHVEFQQLEASWRALHLLVQQAPNDKQILIKVLDISYRELSRDLLSAIEFDQSQIFDKIYTNEFDRPGGQPFGLLIGDYYFSHRSQAAQREGLSVLTAMTKVAAAAFAPFISSLAASFFGLDHYHELKPSLKLEPIFRQQEYLRWQNLRKEEDARFVGLVVPRILMRTPYNANGARLDHRYFNETIQHSNDYLWGNAAFAYGIVAMHAFNRSGWFADIRGISPEDLSGGVVKQLPRDYHHTDAGRVNPKFISEIYITDQLERSLSDQGFLAIKDHPQQNYSVFYSSQSIQKSLQYDQQIASANAKISSMLHYVLCVSRFAHYVKVMMRDKIGSFVSANECESYLQKWILSYCAANPDMSMEAKARYPLNEAKVQIYEQAGAPGKYVCTIHIKPHYQLDDLQSQLRLVTNIKLA